MHTPTPRSRGLSTSLLKRIPLLLTAGLLLASLMVADVHAGKGGGGKPPKDPPGDPPAGAIYYHVFGDVFSMNADGADKTALPNALEGQASHDLHGGQRWFVYHKLLDGGGQYPNGYDRQEIFAISESGGTEVQLTSDPDVLLWFPQWVTESGVGADGSVVAFGLDFTGGSIVEGGLYRLDVTFDGAYGDAVSGSAGPATLYAGFPIVPDSGPPEAPDVGAFSFAPDGDRFAYRQRSTQQVFVWDSGSSSLLVDGGSSPSWSPDGAKIAFDWDGKLYSINPDGGGTSQIASARKKKRMCCAGWSPDSSYVLYHEASIYDYAWDIYRINAGGGGKANLTSDVGRALSLGWR